MWRRPLPEVDLTNCDREPIHVIGHIQPHGALVAIDPTTLAVVQASESVLEHFGLEAGAMLGRSMLDFLPARAAEAFEAAIADPEIEGNPMHLGSVAINGRGPFHLVAHSYEGATILEAEPTVPGDETDYRTLPRRMLRALAEAEGSQAYYDAVVREARVLTGFDRVMLYRFAKDGSGLVVAESVEPHLEPFLGLNYPASDIPQQARRLFALNTVRLYPDVSYVPSPVVPQVNPQSGGPLDMTHCVLRGVSQMHTKYLQNMGVKASMSLAIARGEELWGLIACHHYSVRHVPYPQRAASEFLSRLVSLQVADKEAQDGAGYRNGMRDRLERLTSRLYATPNAQTALAQGEETVLDLIDVGGVALVDRGQIRLLGKTPTEAEVRGLVDWLGEHQREPVWSSAELRAEYAPAAGMVGSAAGLLSAQVSAGSGTYVLWFLPEQVQTLDWAGNPEKPVELSEEGDRLSPRGSFELWRTTVAGHSRPWLDDEIAVAASLRAALVEALVNRADEIMRLNVELERRNADLDTFAQVAAHDLKEPLRGIRNYAQFLNEDYADRLDGEGRDQLETIARLSARLEALLDSLLRFARVSREEFGDVRCDVGMAVDEARSLVGSALARVGGEIEVRGPLPIVSGDFDLTLEIFVNLFTNALKYNESGAPRIVVSAEGTTVRVSDNGIGIPERHREAIFTLFKRLHGRDAYGGGTGMGLTIVKKAMERLGGRVSVESSPGEGTTFVLEFAP